MNNDQRTTRGPVIVAALLLCLMAGAARERNAVWTDEITLWEDASRKSPDRVWTCYNLGRSYLDVRRYYDAFDAFSRTLAIDPALRDAYNGRGIASKHLGRFDPALADYASAIRLDHNDPRAYTNRGILFAEMGRYDRAVEDLTEAINLSRGNAAAYYNRGAAYQESGMIDQAIEDFSAAIERDAGQADAYFARGALIDLYGRPGSAAGDYQHACDLGNDAACSALRARKERPRP